MLGSIRDNCGALLKSLCDRFAAAAVVATTAAAVMAAATPNVLENY